MQRNLASIKSFRGRPSKENKFNIFFLRYLGSVLKLAGNHDNSMAFDIKYCLCPSHIKTPTQSFHGHIIGCQTEKYMFYFSVNTVFRIFKDSVNHVRTILVRDEIYVIFNIKFNI